MSASSAAPALYTIISRPPGAELCDPDTYEPRCEGSGQLERVLTPRIDSRDPRFAVEEFKCPGCPDCWPLWKESP